MSKIIEHFKKITKIPHASRDAEKLLDFLVDFAIRRGYRTEVDDAKNIFISKGEPKLCLQAHYDMVCMGKAPNIETYIENGKMKAKDSSLGADNGVGIAMMMECMEEGKELEFLITADEEVGLIGAGAVSFDLESKYMLNLDSEDDAEVYIGCAGGADIIASKNDTYSDGLGECYEVAVKGLMGGHSGVDIDKGIPSAIKVLGEYLKANKIKQLCSIYAGERRNSISANAVAIIYSTNALKDDGDVKVRVLKEKPKILTTGHFIIDLISNFKQGVLQRNEQLKIPDVSANLAIINTDEKGGIKIEVSVRAMGDKELLKITKEMENLFENDNFSVKVDEKYPAWRPDISAFTNLVTEEMINVFGKSKMMAIHAGLECGVIAKRYPNIKFASIGPDIKFPHSTREEVDLESVEKIYDVLVGVIGKIGH